MTISRLFLTTAALAVSSLCAHAQSQTFTNFFDFLSAGSQTTLTFPKFDSSLGTLTSIDIISSGWIDVEIQFENLDSNPATITSDYGARLRLLRPDTSVISSDETLHTLTDAVTGFDGDLDFGGDSGRFYSHFQDSSPGIFVFLSGATDLSLFTGTGNIVLPLESDSLNSITGSPDLTAFSYTLLSAQVDITYNYEINGASAPEPGSIALMGLGLAGFVAVRRRRRA